MEKPPNRGKFIEIAETIMESIIDQRLNAGDTVPSVRETAMKMGVTPNTAANAHARLRDLEIIKPEHGKGSIVQEDALKRSRDFIRQSFIQQELPLLIRRIKQLDLSNEMLITLVEEARSEKNSRGE